MAHTAKVLTIAVAAYNVAPYIAQCLDSFVDEKLLPALDIVVIDDGSTDATARIVRKYINRFPESFRLVSQENGGYGAAVNHALALAQGEYFKTVDGDDWVDTKELLTVVCYLMDNRERSDVVVTDYCWVRHRDGKEIRRIKTDFAQKQYQHIYSFDEIADKVYLNMHAVTIRTALLQSHNIQLDEHCFYEDQEYILYPIPYCTSITFSPIPLYQYRLGRSGQSVDIKMMIKRHDQHLRVLNALFDYNNVHGSLQTYKKLYLERGIAEAVDDEYQIFLAKGNDEKNIEQMKAFDLKLREEHPGVYAACSRKSVWLLRKTQFKLFPMAAWVYSRLRG